MADFPKSSYDAHQRWIKEMVDNNNLNDGLGRIENKNSINHWRHERMYGMIQPFTSATKSSWLTVGDYVGTDAHHLLGKGIENVVASDISGNLLELSRQKGYIKEFLQLNAENMSLEDNSYDYILCKEAFHHFPRAYLGLYEMIRVSRKAVVMIEPIDIAIHFPLLIFVKNILDKFNTWWINRLWKNRFSFEPVGNYVFKISERELEKVAMGMNLPMIAWKGFNDYYTEQYDLEQPTDTPIFKLVKRKIWRRDLLCRLGLIPYQLMVAVVFKQLPDEELIQKLKENGYRIVPMMKNPYIRSG